jgi:menaquinone-dependent protoporphyrinogen IX oxidase
LRTPGVRPVSYSVFAGAYDPEKVDFVSRMLMEKKNAPTGDSRDSHALQNWVEMLAWQLAA